MRIFSLVLLIAVFGMTSCASEEDYLIKISTRHGEMVGILYDDTPIHKENFIDLARAGRFDSTEFQRVMKTFMIQGGDVFTKEKLPPEEWPTLPHEIRPNHFHKRGAIAAPRQPNAVNPKRESNGSQFYIVDGRVYSELEITTDMKALQSAILKYMELGSQSELKAAYTSLYEQGKYDSLTRLVLSKRDEIAASLNMKLTKDLSPEEIHTYTTLGGAAHLDDEYTVFGELLSGFSVLDKIASEATNSSNRPHNPVYMTVTVEKMSKKEIEEKYDYHYPDAN
ncbi:peptidylprolyl isomerase [Algoriphagus namhaensis]